MTDRWSARLSEYLDGTLGGGEREELHAHLFTCAACAATLAELRRVVERARSLEDREPAEDLWPGIEAAIRRAAAGETLSSESAGEARSDDRIDGRAGTPRRLRVLEGASSSPRLRDRRMSFSMPQLAAAVLALVIGSAGAVWLGGRDDSGGGPAVARQSPPTGDAAGVRMIAEAGEPLTGSRTAEAIAELEQRLEAGRGRLDPATVRILEENLMTIDAALEDARRALEADPGNAYVSAHLAQTVRRKLELLRRWNEIATAQT
ncbi:MAG: zf-HC2 domain-containing protein [Gemmatimonadota bacterium]